MDVGHIVIMYSSVQVQVQVQVQMQAA